MNVTCGNEHGVGIAKVGNAAIIGTYEAKLILTEN